MKSILVMFFVMLAAYANATFADNGQLLASQCYQCHGPNGHSKGKIDSIAGKSAADLYGDLLEMKQKQKIEIMHQQAKSYTNDELRKIADHLSTLR
jgi:cytochrome subunit of sulfide dehydrogenase